MTASAVGACKPFCEGGSTRGNGVAAGGAPSSPNASGADVATAPPAVLKGLVKHQLTDKGLEAFMADWQKTGQSIL